MQTQAKKAQTIRNKFQGKTLDFEQPIFSITSDQKRIARSNKKVFLE
jgi:hypothetical protein